MPMADKKIELEKIKSKTDITKAKQAAKAVEKKPEAKKSEAKKPAPKKKKTVSEEARDMGLIYIGGGKYATRGGVVTHLNENGKLLPFINRNTDIA